MASSTSAGLGAVPAPPPPATGDGGLGTPPGSSAPAPEAGLLEAALFEVKKVIVGQERVIERLFVCLLARGHCLLEGVPGLAKTLAMETLARTVGGTFNRLQFTPDLLPADIVGTRIYRHSSETFDVELGPVFANFVLADEVNRAPAKVQSALLEVMAERQVSIAGQTFPAPDPFLVLATQNPIESEGVYALPEAQRDRFLMKVLVGYPSRLEEVEIVHRISTGTPSVRQVLSAADLVRLQRTALEVYVDPSVVDYAVNLVLATRAPGSFGLSELEPLIEYGASPRASLGLVAAGRALALLRGRRYALPQDVFDVAPEVLRHRLVLSYEALAQGLIVDQLTARVLSTVPAPRVTPMLEAAEYAPAAARPGPATPVGLGLRPGEARGPLPTMPRRRGGAEGEPAAAGPATGSPPRAGPPRWESPAGGSQQPGPPPAAPPGGPPPATPPGGPPPAPGGSPPLAPPHGPPALPGTVPPAPPRPERPPGAPDPRGSALPPSPLRPPPGARRQPPPAPSSPATPRRTTGPPDPASR